MYGKDESLFARRAMRAYIIYAYLADRESQPAFRALLQELADTCKEQFDFWGRKSGVRGGAVRVSTFALWCYLCARRVLGVATMARYIIGRKERRIIEYTTYCATCVGDDDRRAIEAFVARLHALADQARAIT